MLNLYLKDNFKENVIYCERVNVINYQKIVPQLYREDCERCQKRNLNGTLFLAS